MTIDTTLRARAKAVRDAGVKLAAARARFSESAKHASFEQGWRALLDEVDRLRAIFDDAGQGEHNVLALVEHYQEMAMAMEADERAFLAYPRALQAAASVVRNADVTMAYLEPDESEILAWVDDIAEDILELSAEQIEAFDAKVESKAP